MTALEFYQEVQSELEKQACSRSLNPEEHWLYQELAYRSSVLRAFRFLAATAPKTMELEAVIPHYQAMDALVSHLLHERRFADAKDPKEQAARETSYQSLCMLQRDYRRRFSAYHISGEEQYRNDVSKTIESLVHLWIQYRNTMMQI